MRSPAPLSTTCWPGFWAGVGGALLTALFAMVFIPGLTMSSLQEQLEARANAVLKAEGMGWAHVRMEGQRAIVSGAAPSEALRAQAASLVLSSSGPGGEYAGGVTKVINELVVGPAVSPYTWGVRRSPAGVSLTGHVPSDAARAALVQRARQAFGVAPQDTMRLSGGAPKGDWQRVALIAIEQAAKLDAGEARLVDNRLVVIGEGVEGAVAEITARVAQPPAPGFTATADVTVRGRGLGIPELEGVDLKSGSPEACTTAFARLMQNNVINFALDSDVIDPKSAPLLQSLIRVAVRCDGASIEVSGHTDSTGDAATNFALSQRRANAVRRYLIERGVHQERITAQGFGSTRPVADNATPEGQAQNRRIDFTVTP